MTAQRTVYSLAELAGPWELGQPVPVDGTSYTEPLIFLDDVATYTAEDDNADALQTAAVTISADAEDDDVALLVTAVTDETDTAAVATVPEVPEANEKQSIITDHTGGTFTLTFDGDTTGSLNADQETKASIEAALELLPSIGAGNVQVTGGSFLALGYEIEFIGTLAGAPQSDITVTDSGTGGTNGVVIGQVATGGPAVSFSSVGDLNIPQAGDNFQPQLHVWRLNLTTGQAGLAVDFTAADHDTLRSVAGVLLRARNLDTTTPVEVIGGEDAGNDENFGSFGSVTPLTEGAKVLAILAKAISGGAGVYYGATDSSSAPAGTSSVAEALSDALTLNVWASGVLDTDAFSPGDSSWNQSALWAAGLLVLKPDTAASSGSSLAAVTDAEEVTDWIDISDAAGSMYEVIELDLSSLPTDAIVTSANVEIGHSCSVRNALRAVLVGINADDTISPCQEQQLNGYTALPVGQLADLKTADWEQTADGTPISSFSRLGVALISSTRHPFVADHRVFWIRSRVTFDDGGPVVSNVAGPATAGDPITWDYASGEGLAQSHYQVMVVAGSSQDPDAATVPANALEASAGEIVYDSGQVPGVLVRSLSIDDAPLSRGAHTVAVRAWATTSAGQSVSSDWDTADFDISGSPIAPGAQATEPVFNSSTGQIDVEVAVPAGVSRAWLLRSQDSGATYKIVGPFSVTASTTETLNDNAPTSLTTLRYRVTFDNGEMTETGTPVVVGSGADVSSPAAEWFFRVEADQSLNTGVFVREFSIDKTVRSQIARQAGTDGSGQVLVASSKSLGVTMDMEIWLLSGDERRSITAVLDSGHLIRVSDVFGREWDMRLAAGQSLTPRRSKGNLATDRPLRDVHVMNVQLVGSVVVE